MKLIKLFLIVLTIASLYGCTHVIREPLPQIKVAILPMDNQTTNMDGPRLVREKFYRRMQEKYGYITQPIEETDALLKEMGITDGGQLNSVKPQDVGKKLNVDALIYGNLLVFKPVRVSLGAVLKVSYRMLDTNTGGTLWETEDGISALSKINPNESIAENLQNLFKRAAVEKVVRIPLDEETYRLTRRIAAQMPERY